MTLIEIISKYDLCNAGGGTDKSSTHAYVEQFYEKEFAPYREKNISLFGIYILGNVLPYIFGSW